MRRCDVCGLSIVSYRGDARFCSTKCRVAAHRAVLPRELTSRARWVRYGADKRPLTVTGAPASSTNAATWASYVDVRASRVGRGPGFVLGDGIGCIDLDHCLVDGVPTVAAARFLADYPQNYVEISPSGDGLHIWGLRNPMPGTKTVTPDGLSVETYSTGRYITVTGRVFQRGRFLPL